MDSRHWVGCKLSRSFVLLFAGRIGYTGMMGMMGFYGGYNMMSTGSGLAQLF